MRDRRARCSGDPVVSHVTRRHGFLSMRGGRAASEQRHNDDRDEKGSVRRPRAAEHFKTVGRGAPPAHVREQRAIAKTQKRPSPKTKRHTRWQNPRVESGTSQGQNPIRREPRPAAKPKQPRVRSVCRERAKSRGPDSEPAWLSPKTRAQTVRSSQRDGPGLLKTLAHSCAVWRLNQASVPRWLDRCFSHR